MSVDLKPSDWITGITADTNNITIPLASLGVTQANVTDGAGDIRIVAMAFLNTVYAKYNNTAVADRPQHMKLSKGVSVDAATGVNTTYLSGSFDTTVVSQAFVAES